jgi:hypothetical protein
MLKALFSRRVDPQRALVVQGHNHALKEIVRYEVSYASAHVKNADRLAREQVREAAKRAKTDLITTFGPHSWIAAVMEEQQRVPPAADV